MSGALHHFTPDLVQRLFQDAVRTKTPLVIADPNHHFMTIFPLVGFSIIAAISLAWIELFASFDVKRFLFTCVVPVIPFVIAHDAFVSSLRLYSKEDLRKIIDQVEGSEEFSWEIGEGLFDLMTLVMVPKEK